MRSLNVTTPSGRGDSPASTAVVVTTAATSAIIGSSGATYSETGSTTTKVSSATSDSECMISVREADPLS